MLDQMLLVKDLEKKAVADSNMREMITRTAWVVLIVVCVSIVFLGWRQWKPRLKRFIAMEIKEDVSSVET